MTNRFSLWFKELIVGFFIGVANIIPGVSGGTFLLIFGIYERVIGILNNLGPKTFKTILNKKLAILTSPDKKEATKNLFQTIADLDLWFLLRILIGALVAIIVLSSIMKGLLVNHFSVTYALFFGLILISIIIPYNLLKQKKIIYLLPFAIGTILTLFVSLSVNPYDKTKGKSDIYKARLESKEVKISTKADSDKTFSYIGRYTPADFGYSAFCGAIAISAMVLPGISGSLVMILMGEYFEVISAISGMKTLHLDYFVFLGCLAIGMLIGLLLFAKLVDFIFKRYYNITMSFLLGLMVGSLYTLWPFKEYIIMDQYVKHSGTITMIKDAIVYTNKNTLWETPQQLISVIISSLIGSAIMFFFVKKESLKN
jgi:putative membrane protein